MHRLCRPKLTLSRGLLSLVVVDASIPSGAVSNIIGMHIHGCLQTGQLKFLLESSIRSLHPPKHRLSSRIRVGIRQPSFDYRFRLISGENERRQKGARESRQSTNFSNQITLQDQRTLRHHRSFFPHSSLVFLYSVWALQRMGCEYVSLPLSNGSLSCTFLHGTDTDCMTP